jgi:outer membrane lipoprotein carrier protein
MFMTTKDSRMKVCVRIAAAAILISTVLLLPSLGDCESITERMQRQYESLQSFRAQFSQVLTNSVSRESEERAGTIEFMQPSLVRWTTVTPEKEVLVVGRKFVWDYYPADEAAFKYRLDQMFSSKTMLRFLSGQANLVEDFVVDKQDKEKGLVHLYLVPKNPEPGLVRAEAWIDPDTALLRGVLIEDFYGNTNQLFLRNIKLNVGLTAEHFDFTPPKGVVVQDSSIEEMLDPGD